MTGIRMTEEQYQAVIARQRAVSAPDRATRAEREPAGMSAPPEPKGAPEGPDCVVLPWPPKELNPNARPHWRTKARVVKAYRSACRAHAERVGLRAPDGPIHVWLDIFPPDRRSRDMDNIVASIKAGLDGLADALGVDDSRFVIRPFLRDEVGGMVRVRLTAGPQE